MAALFPPTGGINAGAHGGPPPPDGPGGPPGSPFNPVASSSDYHSLIAFTVIMTTTAIIAVGARLYTRFFIANRIGTDDYMAVGALVTTIAYNVGQCVNVVLYLGPFNMSGDGGMAGKLYFANEIFYNFAMAFIKMTFLFQFFHIFQYVYRMRIAYIVAMVVVGAWSVSQMLLPLFVCRPIQANWDASVPGTVCIDSIVPTYGNAAGTIMSDIIVLFLPLPTLWSLRLSTSQKWAVLGVFGIGAIVPVISAVRVWTIGLPPPSGPLANGYATMSELTAGIIAAALATVRLLVSRHFPALPNSQAPRSNGKISFLSKLPSFGTSHTNTQLSSHHNYGNSEEDLFNNNSFIPGNGLVPEHGALALENMESGGHANLRLGVRTKISTGKYNRSVSDGAAEFLGEFGIRVERNVEVEIQETTIVK